MSSFLTRGLAACLLLTVPALPEVHAQDPSTGASPVSPANPGTLPSLTLREALESALKGNPGLANFSFRLSARDARLRRAELRPAPALTLTAENVLGTGALRGLGSAEVTLALSQVVELGDKRNRRITVAAYEREDVSVEQQAAQLDVLAEVTRRFIHVASDQAQLALTRSATALVQTTVEGVTRRVQAGKSPEVELIRARAALTRAHRPAACRA
ncbi:MAG: TolC family protein [Gammaproteobacteria bacterium]|nr:TolC family protein [Gammaproteobacteria bacterium]